MQSTASSFSSEHNTDEQPPRDPTGWVVLQPAQVSTNFSSNENTRSTSAQERSAPSHLDSQLPACSDYTPGPGLEHAGISPELQQRLATKLEEKLRLESQVNPFATQQHHARSMMYLIQARASPDTTYLSYTFLHLPILLRGEGRRQHFSFKQR